MRLVVFVTAVLALGTASASAEDLARGEQTFKKCAACHAVGEGAKNKSGPVLNGVFGRTAGTFADFKYSKPMIEAGAGGLVWTPETIGQFLHKPRDFVKGTKMSFPGLTKEDEIENLVAFLQTFSPDYVPAEGESEDQEEGDDD